ncbi:MAG TPA: hypothetical protein VFD84_20100 [Candidatus Binatia bacterium]|nr:hypothetical protein [Candidatus Binatia bacterium]
MRRGEAEQPIVDAAYQPIDDEQGNAVGRLHGAGCDFMLQQGVAPDFAIAAKPVYAVSWEEAGLCWFRVTVKGNFGYSGTRHVVPYGNAIANAAKVILRIPPTCGRSTRTASSTPSSPPSVHGAPRPRGGVGDDARRPRLANGPAKLDRPVVHAGVGARRRTAARVRSRRLIVDTCTAGVDEVGLGRA